MSAEFFERLDVGAIEGEAAVLSDGKVDADWVFVEFASSDLIGIGAGFDEKSGLSSAGFVEADGDGGFEIEHGGAGNAEHGVDDWSHAEGFGDDFVVIAFVEEIEAEEKVQCFAVEWTDRKHVGDQFENESVLCARGFEVGRINVATADAFRFQGEPAIAVVVFIFFENEVAVFSGVEIPHRRIRFLNAFEKVEDGFP